MIESLLGRRHGFKWRPRQRFIRTESGDVAVRSYRDAVDTLPRGEHAREALDAAVLGWATAHHVESSDASILVELTEKGLQHRHILAALEDTGLSLVQVQDAVDRLYTAGLIAPIDGQTPESRGQA